MIDDSANMRCSAICRHAYQWLNRHFFKEFGLACLHENTQGLSECGRKGPNAWVSRKMCETWQVCVMTTFIDLFLQDNDTPAVSPSAKPLGELLL